MENLKPTTRPLDVGARVRGRLERQRAENPIDPETLRELYAQTLWKMPIGEEENTEDRLSA
ncbi:hypothetical protein KKC44_03000 [Patescibacteria group bacterium]|nr:hypothetical protein [Patescibacteria group bacterium]MBU2259553.1 hypothetical protein [Patescibacteria group bacterium]